MAPTNKRTAVGANVSNPKKSKSGESVFEESIAKMQQSYETRKKERVGDQQKIKELETKVEKSTTKVVKLEKKVAKLTKKVEELKKIQNDFNQMKQEI